MKTAYYALIFLIMSPGNALCNNDSAESHVKKFYQMYASCETTQSIYSDLSAYVDPCVLSTIRILNNRDYYAFEYFTKSQDCWGNLTDEFVVHKEMKINDATSIVPISFKWSQNKQHHLLVFVRKEKDGWRIIKVSGTEYFFE